MKPINNARPTGRPSHAPPLADIDEQIEATFFKVLREAISAVDPHHIPGDFDALAAKLRLNLFPTLVASTRNGFVMHQGPVLDPGTLGVLVVGTSQAWAPESHRGARHAAMPYLFGGGVSHEAIEYARDAPFEVDGVEHNLAEYPLPLIGGGALRGVMMRPAGTLKLDDERINITLAHLAGRLLGWLDVPGDGPFNNCLIVVLPPELEGSTPPVATWSAIEIKLPPVLIEELRGVAA